MTPPHTFSGRAKIAMYAGVAAIVMAYVAVTTGSRGSQPPSTSSAPMSVDAERSALAHRLLAAAVALGVWVVIDVAVAHYLRSSDATTHYLVRILLGWGLLLALGAMLSAGHHRKLAAIIVFGVTAAFIGLWLAALATRRHAKFTP
jgi:hypothetical protein